MPRRGVILLGLALLWSCGESDSPGSEPGPLVDNTQWQATDKGDAFFGPPPPSAECEPPLIDPNCPAWPESGDCIEKPAECTSSYLPECLQGFTTLAVYTRLPGDDGQSLCDWVTLEQPLLRAIRAGDQIEIRTRHSQLTAPVSGTARISFTIGDQMAFDREINIPRMESQVITEVWTSPKNFDAGTPMLFHVNNHGANEYLLIEVNVL